MKKIIFAICTFFVLSANAAAPSYMYGVLTPRQYYDSNSAACSAYGATRTGFSPWVPHSTIATRCVATNLGNGMADSYNMAYDLRCSPAGTAPNTSLPLAQQCSDPPPLCTPGKQYTVEVLMGTVSAPEMKYPTQLNGCRVYVGGVQECNSNKTTGALQCTLRVTEGGVAPTGGTNDSSVAPIADPKPQDVPPHNPGLGQGCPDGTVSLGIDSTGGSICGGKGTSPAEPTKTEVKEPPVTTNNADGSVTKTEVTTKTNSDGSTTTTTKTTNTGTDGKVTTTEKSVTGDKPSTGTSTPEKGVDDSKEEDKSDLCKQHPELNICKNSEVIQGSCSNGTDSTSCTGDAIQCAILREQKRQFCELNKENPSATLGNQAIAGNDPIKSTLPTKENASAINMQALSQASFLGGGSCFADKSFSLQGLTVSLPFSKVCPYLEWLRYVVMLIAALVSLKIVSKPVLGD